LTFEIRTVIILNQNKGGAKLKILITGLGITGKSSLLKWLKTFLPLIQNTIMLDLDYDREKLPKAFEPNILYVLEDVHGPTKNAVIPLIEYNLILYLLPSWFTHLKYWLARMHIWYQLGLYAWDPDKDQRRGTGKSKDWRNLPGIFKEFVAHFPKRSSTIDEDLVVLKTSSITTLLVIPKGRGEKIFFRFKTL